MSENTISISKAATLWSSDPSKRKIVPVIDPQTFFIAQADGAKPGAGAPLEYRATIKAGLLALADAGIEPYATNRAVYQDLKTKEWPFQKNAEDEAVTAAVGLSGHSLDDLEKAAEKVQKEVNKAGSEVRSLAWAYRAMFILERIKGWAALHGAIVGVLSLIPVPPLQIAAAASGVQATASAIAAKAVTNKYLDLANDSILALAEKRNRIAKKYPPLTSLEDYWKTQKSYAANLRRKDEIAREQQAIVSLPKTSQTKAIAAWAKKSQPILQDIVNQKKQLDQFELAFGGKPPTEAQMKSTANAVTKAAPTAVSAANTNAITSTIASIPTSIKAGAVVVAGAGLLYLLLKPRA